MVDVPTKIEFDGLAAAVTALDGDVQALTRGQQELTERVEALHADPEPPPDDVVRIWPGDDYQARLNTSPTGTHFILQGEYPDWQALPRNGQTFEADTWARLLAPAGDETFAFAGRGVDVTLRGLEAVGYHPRRKHAAVDGSDGARWRLEGLDIHDTLNDGIRIGPDMYILGGKVARASILGVGGRGDGVTIDGVELTECGTARYAPVESGGLKIVKSHGLLIIRADVHDNFGAGIWLDIYNGGNQAGDVVLPGVEVVESYVYDNLAQGIHYEVSAAGDLLRNILWGNAEGYAPFGNPDNPGIAAAQIRSANSRQVRIEGCEIEFSARSHGIGVTQQRRHEHPNWSTIDVLSTLNRVRRTSGTGKHWGLGNYWSGRPAVDVVFAPDNVRL